MAGLFSGESFKAMFRGLGREEILEVLSEGLCEHCDSAVRTRLQDLINRKYGELSVSNGKSAENCEEFWSEDSPGMALSERNPKSSGNRTSWGPERTPESVHSGWRECVAVNSLPASMSSKALSSTYSGHAANSSPAAVNSRHISSNHSKFDILLNDGISGVSSVVDGSLSDKRKEQIRLGQVVRKKDFVHLERIDGKMTNILKGLELHSQVFNAEEQKKIVQCIYNLQKMGQKGQLRERTYSEPRKWMRGKGRVTIQFGCCYNYAVDKNGNPPGIVRDEEVDPLPPMFKQMIKRMVRWHVLPPTCVPNSCIVNIYDEGDCIPPHIDHHDFLRPFCTVSFLTQCNIVFGENLKIVGPGEFSGPVAIPLPVGSVLILSGNGADIAKHCVPAVPARRISITFRKMDESKIPYKYLPDPELQGQKLLLSSPSAKLPIQQNPNGNNKAFVQEDPRRAVKPAYNSYHVEKDDFPPLGSSNSSRKANRN